ncbi:molecular chaperone GrpE [Cohnella kolymensis]|uniref:Protein GrpE n=2 Tax=Cohnella kolymensis TaxID=1590652 RepID=A0ABR5A9G5_9BACL|nr:molecular chaperone GrpE [Cohnella kolymensis]
MSEHQEDSLEENMLSDNDSSPAEAENNVDTGGGEVDRIAELQREAEENHNRYLRAQADFDNFRRRTMKEKEELAQYASLKLVGQLLPVLDNFQRALHTGEGADSASFTKGIEMIYRQLSQVLEDEGLKPMEPVGQPFDPELHQAIMQVETDEYEEGIVVEVVQPGYRMKDKIIRPAMVKVSG